MSRTVAARTRLIGVFLIALSVGYAVGGRIADRYPSPHLLCGIVFVAGVTTLPIPAIGPPVLRAIAEADFGAQLNPLLAAVALFAVPSILLAVVSPFAVRLRLHALATAGRTAGYLYALSTVGSIVGTFATAFFLINYVGVRGIVTLLGLGLITVATIGWFAAREVPAAVGGITICVVLSLALAAAARHSSSKSLIYAEDTAYSTITVSDAGSLRYLKLDNHLQSAIDQASPRRVVFPYTTYLHLPLVFIGSPRRATMIGLGGGIVPTRYVADYADVVIHVVEIDARVVETATRFFGMHADERLQVHVQDGRLHLAQTEELQDLILIDAYLADMIPFHLMTREFFALARARLRPGGALTVNIIGAAEGSRSQRFRAVYKTLGEIFATLYVFPVGFAEYGVPTEHRNIIIVATNEPALTAVEVGRRARRLTDAGVVTVEGFGEAADSLYELPIETVDVPCLTDDYAPMERLLSRQR